MTTLAAQTSYFPSVPTMRPYTDEDLSALVVAAQRSPEAFGRLYDRFVGVVYRYVYVRLGSNRAAAEDATSEVFTRALAGLGRFREGNFAAWLLRIAHNVVVDQYRKKEPARGTLPREDDVVGIDPPDPSLGPEEQVVARAEASTLRAALANLPPDQRAVLELQLAGASGEEIAATLKKSDEAVRMLRYRAIGRLRTILRDAEPAVGRST